MIRGIYSNDSGEWFVDEQFITDDGSMSAVKTRPATAEEIALVEDIASGQTEAAEAEPNQAPE